MKNQSKQKTSNHIQRRSSRRNSQLPPNFYQNLLEAENKFQSDPSMESCERLILLYKQGTEYYSNINGSKEHNYFVNSIQKIISAQMTTRILSNKNEKKKKWHSNIKNQIAMYNLEQYDYKKDVRTIIDKCEKSIKNSLDILSKITNSQKTQFRKNIRKKIFKSRFEKIKEDEEEEIENDNIIFNKDDITLNNKRKSSEEFIRKRQRYNSITRLYSSNNFLSLSRSSFFGLKRKKSINLEENNNSKSKVRLNRPNTEVLDEVVNKVQKKDFHPKQDLSQDLFQFLKNYSIKLHYLFQTPLNETLKKLNIIFEKNYDEMKNSYLEYEENVKGYLSLTEDPTVEPFKTLIESLKTEFNESLFLINTSEEKEIQTLTEEMQKNRLVDTISISNLNDDTIAQIAEVFK